MNRRTQANRSEDAERFEAVRSSLAERITRWTAGVEQFATASPGLTLYRHDAPTEAMSCMLEPAIALTIQGAKRALLGDDVFAYNRHRFLITSLDLPVVLRTVEASREDPYLSVVLRMDERLIAELMLQTELPRSSRERPLGRGISLGRTTVTLLEAFDRLVLLIEASPDFIQLHSTGLFQGKISIQCLN